MSAFDCRLLNEDPLAAKPGLDRDVAFLDASDPSIAADRFLHGVEKDSGVVAKLTAASAVRSQRDGSAPGGLAIA